MASNDAVLRADHVSFSYEQSPALDNVSVVLSTGDMVALAGPNGSGKSTLLKLLTGVRPAGAGSVTLNGVSLAVLPPRARARYISAVSQHVDPHLRFTVEAIVSMGRLPYTRMLAAQSPADRNAVQRAMEATGVVGLAGRNFDELSGGEQQRVVIALALAQEARFLLLDEPTVHLDLFHQHQVLELLVQLHRDRGIGILAVLHDINLAALYFRRLAVMHHGKLVADGEPDEVVGGEDFQRIFQAPIRLVRHPGTGVRQVLLDRSPPSDRLP